MKTPDNIKYLEAHVLGAIMLEKDLELKIFEILEPSDFDDPKHREIYKTIIDISESNKEIEYHSVIRELQKNKMLEYVGGLGYVVGLTTKIGSGASAVQHSKEIKEASAKRVVWRIGATVQQMAEDPGTDIAKIMEYAQEEFFKIGTGFDKRDAVRLGTIIDERLNALEKLTREGREFTGVPSGYAELDRVTAGWQPSDLIVLAARPSMGKTALALSMVRNMAVNHKVPAAFFSLEMSKDQLANRLISSETEVSGEKFRNGRLSGNEWSLIENNIGRLVDAPIYIDDTPALSLFDLRTKARQMVLRHGIKIIVIDYLQLMTADTRNPGMPREQQVSSISRGLKLLAKELNIPVIALSQLNRAIEARSGDKRPQLSDLRESGAIEQDTDIVMFINRPEKYGILEDHEGNSTKGIGELIIAKHRNGSLADVQLKFTEQFARFDEFEPQMEDVTDISADYSSAETEFNKTEKAPF